MHSLQVGGLENGVVNLINNLDPEIFTHSICCVDSMGPMAERIHQPVSFYSLEKGERRDYFISLKIAKIISRADPAIIHTRNWSAIDGIIGARLTGKRIVVHGEHGREASDPKGENRRRKRIRHLLSPWVSKYVAVSKELKEWLVHDVGIAPEKVMQIINGVDTDSNKPVENKGYLKKELGLAPGTFVIGSVGRLDPVKDHATLLRAFRAVAGRFNGRKLALIIVGTGPMLEELKTIAEELNISRDVIFTGERDDVARFYNCMDVYVLPSVAEGISNTVLEAMASGLPVIASDRGGNLELVVQEESGFFFSSGSHEQLCDLICKYIDNDLLRHKHATNSRQRAVNKFSIDQMTAKYAALYESAINGKRCPGV